MTKKTVLTQGRLHELFKYDPVAGVLSWNMRRRGTKFGAPAGWVSAGYIRIRVDGIEYFAHRLVWLYHYGRWPEFEIDHINRVRDDNRIENLRDVPSYVNTLNRATYGRSGFKGVRKTPSSRFVAEIKIFEKVVRLGLYDTAEEAHDAFKQVHRDLHREQSEYWGEAA